MKYDKIVYLPFDEEEREYAEIDYSYFKVDIPRVLVSSLKELREHVTEKSLTIISERFVDESIPAMRELLDELPWLNVKYSQFDDPEPVMTNAFCLMCEEKYEPRITSDYLNHIFYEFQYPNRFQTHQED